MKKVMIATGGTGGHIYPALAFAEILKRKYPACEIVFFGSDDRMEKDIIPEKGYRFIGMYMQGMNGGIKAKVHALFSLLKAERACKKLLKEEKPDACVGFGNYISVPLIMAAKSLGIKTMLQEQNSYAGKANRMLARYVDAIAVSSKISLEQFPAKKTRVLGNPQATIASEKKLNKEDLKAYGLDLSKPFILFMMGSLGSSSVAKVIDEALPNIYKDYEVLIDVGKNNDYKFKETGDARVHIVPYVDGLLVLTHASLSVLRAGATTLSEITALGCASILIPSPYVPNNHQVHNALELVDNEAALMIEEKDLTASSLSKTINALLDDTNQLESLKTHAKHLGCTDAAYKMVEWLEEL